MFDSVEKYYLRKLLSKLKYSDLNTFEMNELAFNPIVNKIIEKLEDVETEKNAEKFYLQHPNVKKNCFEFENHVGVAIRERLKYFDESVFNVILKWNREEVENYVKTILGAISYEIEEFDKLVDYLINLAKQETSG